MTDQAQLLELASGVDDRVTVVEEGVDGAAIECPAEALAEVMTKLRDHAELSFILLLDHLAVDWLADEKFELIYRLQSLKLNAQLEVRVFVPRDKPEAPTLTGVWPIAEFQEREVYDLMGIVYTGHPDLRRLFLEDDWEGYPLRKDYEDDFMLERPS